MVIVSLRGNSVLSLPYQQREAERPTNLWRWRKTTPTAKGGDDKDDAKIPGLETETEDKQREWGRGEEAGKVTQLEGNKKIQAVTKQFVASELVYFSVVRNL